MGDLDTVVILLTILVVMLTIITITTLAILIVVLVKIKKVANNVGTTAQNVAAATEWLKPTKLFAELATALRRK